MGPWLLLNTEKFQCVLNLLKDIFIPFLSRYEIPIVKSAYGTQASRLTKMIVFWLYHFPQIRFELFVSRSFIKRGKQTVPSFGLLLSDNFFILLLANLVNSFITETYVLSSTVQCAEHMRRACNHILDDRLLYVVVHAFN